MFPRILGMNGVMDVGAPRKNPPANILETIEQYVAGEGGSTVILARAIGVSSSTVNRWFDEDEKLKEAYEGAREAHMHKLYLELMQMSRSGKGNVAGLIYSIKSKYKQYDIPTPGKLVDVNVQQVTNVMVVKSHGTDEEWAAKAAAQQLALTEGSSAQARIDAPHPAQIASEAIVAPPSYVRPSYAVETAVWRANP